MVTTIQRIINELMLKLDATQGYTTWEDICDAIKQSNIFPRGLNINAIRNDLQLMEDGKHIIRVRGKSMADEAYSFPSTPYDEKVKVTYEPTYQTYRVSYHRLLR